MSWRSLSLSICAIAFHFLDVKDGVKVNIKLGIRCEGLGIRCEELGIGELGIRV